MEILVTGVKGFGGVMLRQIPFPDLRKSQRTSLGERSKRFSRNLGVAGSSPARDIMVYLLKALETFTLETPDVIEHAA